METKHTDLVNLVVEEFLKNKFVVETEKPLPFGKGAVDVFAEKGDLKIYMELKSSPASINSKKANSQLNRYKQFFGKDNLYCLVSPGFDGVPRIQSLDGKINCSLTNFYN
ncbi:Uncharacterised protein [uncultured archaeon]|nr:Uncharacterised protein [uncultured archaeon]